MTSNEDSSFPADASSVFKRLPAKKREQVFQAAVEELALNGFKGASLNRLAGTAGISKGSLFQYFGSKLGLFRAVGTTAVERVRAYLRKVRDETRDLTLEERLEALANSGFRFVDDHPMLSGVFFNVLIRGGGAEGETQMAALRNEGSGFLAGLIREAVDKGEVSRDIEPDIAAHALFLILEDGLREYFSRSRSASKGPDAETERQLTAVLRLTIRGLAPRTDDPGK